MPAPASTVPNTRRYTDLPVIAAQRWDSVTAVRQALTELSRGQFVNVAMMVEEMVADDRISGVVSQRIDGLLGLPFRMTTAEDLEEDEHALEVASDAAKAWDKVAPASNLRELWRWGRFLGIGVAEKIWVTADGRWTPTLKVWHPRFVYWRWDTRSYWLTTQEGPVELVEGDPKWVLYTPYGYRRGWVDGLVRSLAIPWLFRQFSYRDWGRFNEVHGMPIRGIIEPAEWSDDEKQKALTEIAALASESVVRLPQTADGRGFDMKLIEAAARSFDGFKLAIEQANSSIAIVILGQNLTTEVKGGAYSAAQVHERVASSIIAADASTLSTTLRDQVLVEWATHNYGDPELAPWPRWSTEPPADVKGAAEGLKSLGEAVTALKAAGIPVDRAELMERYDVPLEDGAEFGGGEGDAPAGAAELEPGATPADGAVVQDTALNGAQVQALQAIVQAVAAGQLPPTTARAMIVAAFPAVPAETVDAMLAGLESFKPAAPPPAPAPPGHPEPDDDDAGGSPDGDDDDAAPVATSRVEELEELARRQRAANQAQVYVDQVADHGRAHAARILAGDVRALMRVIDELKPTATGGIDVDALRKKLLEAYAEMSPDKLARLTEKCLIMAELSGRLAVQKEI